MSYNYTMEEKKSIFTTASDTMATNTTVSFVSIINSSKLYVCVKCCRVGKTFDASIRVFVR